LIISDVMMPRANGYDILEKIRIALSTLWWLVNYWLIILINLAQVSHFGIV